jgi:hypothetical protein
VGLFNILLHLDHDCLDGLVFDGYIMSGAFVALRTLCFGKDEFCFENMV